MGLLDVHRIPDAKKHLQLVRELQPGNQFARYLWSRALVEEGACSEAIQFLQDLTERGFEGLEAHFLLVNALRCNGELQRAADQAVRLTQRFPDSAAAHLNAALELQFLGKSGETEAHLRKALKLADHGSKTFKEAQFSLARVLIRTGNLSEAANLLEGIVRANAEDVPARLELGEVFVKVRRLHDAVQILEQAVKLDPKNKRARMLLGSALVRLGKQAEADQQLAAFEKLESEETRTSADQFGVYTKGTR
jgi:predicted Zn-dependent protease